jgi:hypothetical protein
MLGSGQNVRRRYRPVSRPGSGVGRVSLTGGARRPEPQVEGLHSELQKASCRSLASSVPRRAGSTESRRGDSGRTFAWVCHRHCLEPGACLTILLSSQWSARQTSGAHLTGSSSRGGAHVHGINLKDALRRGTLEHGRQAAHSLVRCGSAHPSPRRTHRTFRSDRRFRVVGVRQPRRRIISR